MIRVGNPLCLWRAIIREGGREARRRPVLSLRGSLESIRTARVPFLWFASSLPGHLTTRSSSLLATAALVAYGSYAFFSVNVEAYPDPAPAIIEVVAQYPGASAEEVERQVTIPLEVTLAGMPGLTHLRSKSLFGLAHLRNQFEYGVDYEEARQEVINRLQFTQQLPPGVTPQLSPQSPTGEIYRYTLNSPKDPSGRDVYTLNDLKALQDWVLEREFRRVPRIIDVTSCGGTVKRYEIHPDPDRHEPLRHHLAAAPERPHQHQRQRRRRLPDPGPRRPERAAASA